MLRHLRHTLSLLRRHISAHESFSDESILMKTGDLFKKRSIPHEIIVVMLLWAVYPGNPYAYYTLLHWACCAYFAYLAFRANDLGKIEWVWILSFAAFIYNPVIPVHLNREIWSVVNIATAIAALISIRTLGGGDNA